MISTELPLFLAPNFAANNDEDDQSKKANDKRNDNHRCIRPLAL